ncbi:hypothetical protein DID88_006828 [Monilinia fructigena]|uniref:Stc1 domain-containing protein n=1 Tax=Monilinia fructigena TaxID=38457 RepID=A0A395IGI6_9HELO|nr:hypothetical protein DID88_006828 [Monilinia fructigena]
MSYRNNRYSPASQRNGAVIPIGCKGEQVQELQCEGPCGQVKVLDLFSKAQRSRGNKWCMECVHWKEGHHPEVDLTSAPGSEPAPHATTPPPVETTGSYAASMAALSQRASSLAVGSTPYGSQLAPHLRPVAGSGSENRSQSSVSNPFEGARTADLPADGWVTRDSRRRTGPAMRYNAYDSNGIRHSQQKAMTLTSVTTSTVGESSFASVTGESPRVAAVTVPRPFAPAPAPASQPVRVVTNQNTGWAKPVGQRTRQPVNPGSITEWAPESNAPYRRSVYDSSDDEM